MMRIFSRDGHFDAKAQATMRRSSVSIDHERDMSKLHTEVYLPK